MANFNYTALQTVIGRTLTANLTNTLANIIVNDVSGDAYLKINSIRFATVANAQANVLVFLNKPSINTTVLYSRVIVPPKSFGFALQRGDLIHLETSDFISARSELSNVASTISYEIVTANAYPLTANNVNLSNIQGMVCGSRFFNLTTDTTANIFNDPNTLSTFKVNYLQVTNRSNLHANVTLINYKINPNIFLPNTGNILADLVVPAFRTLEISNLDNYFYIENGDSLLAVANANSALSLYADLDIVSHIQSNAQVIALRANI